MAKTSLVVKAKKLKHKSKYRTRVYNRCNLCGRSRGYIRNFGICRICFRERAQKGEIPGIRKSSW